MSSNQVSLESSPHPSWLNVGSRVVGMCFVLSCPCQYVQSVQCYAVHGLSMTEVKHLVDSLKLLGLRIPACRRTIGTSIAPFCNLRVWVLFRLIALACVQKRGHVLLGKLYC